MKVTPEVIAIDFEGRVWAYLYREGLGFTLIDAGIAGRIGLIAQSLRGIGAELTDIRQIVITHFHSDHAGTLAELQRLTGARTLAHSLDAPVVRGEAMAPAPLLSRTEQPMYEYLSKDIPDAAPATVHGELSEGDELDFGGVARVIHLPGHTDGSIGIYLPAQGIVFTGDAAASLNGRPIVGLFNVDPGQAKRSFQRLAALRIETAYFGHGPRSLARLPRASDRRSSTLMRARNSRCKFELYLELSAHAHLTYNRFAISRISPEVLPWC